MIRLGILADGDHIPRHDVGATYFGVRAEVACSQPAAAIGLGLPGRCQTSRQALRARIDVFFSGSQPVLMKAGQSSGGSSPGVS